MSRKTKQVINHPATYMPRGASAQLGEELEGQDVKIDPGTKSPLGIYLRLNGISATSFARAMGVAYRTVDQWVNGSVELSLAAAYEIERLTKGIVCMEMWLALPKVKAQLATWRSYQPEELAESRPAEANMAGGLAHPALESRQASRNERKAAGKAIIFKPRRRGNGASARKRKAALAVGEGRVKGQSGGGPDRFHALMAEIEGEG